MRLLVALMSTLLVVACSQSNSTQQRNLDDPLPRSFVDDPACPAPRCFETQIPLPDDVTVGGDTVRIILPDGYDDSDESYPVIYLLHDAPGSYLSWTQDGEVVDKLGDAKVIAVMPDGGAGNPGWYSDWLDCSFQWQRYHMDVMLPYLESKLRVLGDGHRAIAGPSMGGYGAMYYSASYPDRFAAAAGFSGAVDFLHLDRASALYAFIAGFSGVTPGMPIWGDPIQNFDKWQAQDPGSHVENLLNTKIYLTSGNGLPGGPHENLPAGAAEYGIEPFLLLMNQSLADTLTAAGVEHETWFYGPGYHNWPYYRDGFDWAWPKLWNAIKPKQAVE